VGFEALSLVARGRSTAARSRGASRCGLERLEGLHAPPTVGWNLDGFM
jgi:hypothetical protein